MKIAKTFIYLGSLAMIGALINIFLNGNLALDGPMLLSNPWGLVSVIDLYLGLILFTIWMVFREKNIIFILVMLALTSVFGFLAASIYILINLKSSQGDWKKFFLGHRKDLITGDN